MAVRYSDAQLDAFVLNHHDWTLRDIADATGRWPSEVHASRVRVGSTGKRPKKKKNTPCAAANEQSNPSPAVAAPQAVANGLLDDAWRQSSSAERERFLVSIGAEIGLRDALGRLKSDRERVMDYLVTRDLISNLPSRGYRLINLVLSGGDLAMVDLGASYTETIAQIQARYRRLTLACHPDRGGSEVMQKRLNSAFMVVREGIR